MPRKDGSTMHKKNLRKFFLVISLGLITAGAAFAVPKVLAHTSQSPVLEASPLHPTFAMLDESGENVLISGAPVSTMNTCGQCHDTSFIASHSFHSDMGLSEMTAPGQTSSGRPWDTSTGSFGKWNPLSYRYLSLEGDERLDLSTAEWIQSIGSRHIGGGPAVTSRNGTPLIEVNYRSTNPEVNYLDPLTGAPAAWNWTKSGVIEMNCFLCHLVQPDNAARLQAIKAGQFSWANTATLAATGIASDGEAGWTWNAAAFDATGELKPEYVTLQDPTNENCAQCHGVAHTNTDAALVISGCDTQSWQTATTGQVISPEKISQSGLNLAGKSEIDRSWDVHAERGLKCTDCHFSLNNPVYYQASSDTQLEFLSFDPRRLEIGEYLLMPDHQFARGESAQVTIAPELKGTMRRCESCHNAETTHDWLPYVDRHMDEVACETCHIPQIYAPAVQQVDWTVITATGNPLIICRGVEGNTGTLNDLVTGFQPVLMPRQNIDGEVKLAPYNLVSAWYWVYEDVVGNIRPVRLEDLRAAWLDKGRYAPEVLHTFDINQDGMLDDAELQLDTPDKQAVITRRLSGLGLINPHIHGEIQPYSINHNVTSSQWAVKDCQTCHDKDSRVSAPIVLANYVPANFTPKFVGDTNTRTDGEIYTEGNLLYYSPSPQSQDLYVFGHSRVNWIDLLGGLLFVGVLGAVTVHGGLRFYGSLRKKQHTGAIQRVYMYAVYERFWHWLQTFAIVLLLFTGLIIHRPDIFAVFSFSPVVIVHNVLAVLLVINAGLSLFYHLASGEIRQFIPRPYGFFDQAIIQAKYYIQGIFKGSPHPFEKNPQKKMNPLQQVTYFGILNVLLPLQIISGALMWGVQRWSRLAEALGGLPLLAPFHSLVAWTFGSFIVAHVYLTTTVGSQPLDGIKAMVNGWEEVELPEEAGTKEESASPTSEEAQPSE